ncbi:MAG: NHLP bacteriocin export ABC transporter permease/ATPase subunit [Thermoanaerobaculia bacterium]
MPDAVEPRAALDAIATAAGGAGPTRRGGPGSAFPIEAGTRAWLVREGSVDVFFEPESGGGPRRHVCRVEAGSALLALPALEGAGSVRAVPGPDATLVDVALARLLSLGGDAAVGEAVVALVEGWLHSLAAGLSEDELPPRTSRTPIEEAAVAGEGHWLVSRRDVRWVEVRSGELLPYGDPTATPFGAGTTAPVCAGFWLKVARDAELEWLSTAQVAGRPGGLANALASFGRSVVELLERRQARAAEEARARLLRRASSVRTLRSEAEEQLASVLGTRLPTASAAEDALAVACRLVAGAGGVTIRPAPAGAPEPRTLAAIAADSGVRVREVLLRDGWWKRDGGPVLAFAKDDRRPVAILPDGPGRHVVVDPARGARTRVDAGVAATLEPQAHVFYRPLPPGTPHRRALLRFLGFGSGPDLARLFVLGAVAGVLALLTPIGTGLLFGSVIPSDSRSQLAYLVAALVAAGFAVAGLQVVQSFAQLRVSGRAGGAVQAGLVDRLLALPPSFFRRFATGDLANRALAVSFVQDRLAGAASMSVLSALFGLFNVGLLFWYSARLAWFAMLPIALAGVVAAVLFRLLMRHQVPLYEVAGRIQGLTLQLTEGIAKLRVAGAEERAFNRWARAFAEQKRLDLGVRKVLAGVVVLGAVLPPLATGFVFASVGLSTDRSLAGLSLGTFVAFLAALGAVVSSLTMTLSLLFPVLDVVPVWKRSRPILETPTEPSSRRADPGELSGAVEVSRVRFRYHADGPLVLDDVSFRAEPGEFVALVGPSGSGKSTLYRMLLGFESPEAGAVLYDGLDLAGLDLAAVRRQLGAVLQNSQLLNGTVYDNIAGTSRMTMDEAMEAARLCGLEDDVKAMPMGLHTMVGVGGSGLSGGQRQRILIARAIARRPRILLFDEATSALDNHTQAVVSRTLEQLRATRIVIAHRLSTIRNADRIVVLVNGRVVEEGTFDELLASGREFAGLARRQIA